MANKKKDLLRYWEVYEAMQNAVPDDNNMLEVLRGAEMIIADCIAQANYSKEKEEMTYKAIADDIRKFARAFKLTNEEMKLM
jgi:hypothetical protein